MKAGTITRWLRDRGFGFISSDGGEVAVFVHVRNVVDRGDELQPGQRVQFELGINSRNGKPEAREVRLIKG